MQHKRKVFQGIGVKIPRFNNPASFGGANELFVPSPTFTNPSGIEIIAKLFLMKRIESKKTSSPPRNNMPIPQFKIHDVVETKDGSSSGKVLDVTQASGKTVYKIKVFFPESIGIEFYDEEELLLVTQKVAELLELLYE